MIKYRAYITLLCVVLLYFAGNLAWHARQPGGYMILNRDEAIHVRAGLNMYDRIRSGNTMLSQQNAPLPPLVTIAGLLAFGYGGVLRFYTLYVNIFIFAAALFFTYKTGELVAGPAEGLLAALLLALYPSVYGLSRIYGHCDFPVMAAVAFNIFCLLKSDGFKDLKWSVIYGVSAGIGLLTKDTFLAFFLPPLFVVAAFALFDDDRHVVAHLVILPLPLRASGQP